MTPYRLKSIAKLAQHKFHIEALSIVSEHYHLDYYTKQLDLVEQLCNLRGSTDEGLSEFRDIIKEELLSAIEKKEGPETVKELRDVL